MGIRGVPYLALKFAPFSNEKPLRRCVFHAASDEYLSSLLRAAEGMLSEGGIEGAGGGHARSVGACLGLPPATSTALVAVEMYECVGGTLMGWLSQGMK